MTNRLRGVGALFTAYLFGAALASGWASSVLHGVPLTAEIGSVGMQIGVAPNPYNTLAEDLGRREQALNLWEAELKTRMAAANRVTESQDRTTLALLIGGGALFALVALNFYLDFRDRVAHGGNVIPPFRSSAS